jgi:hypothetical protein
MLQFGEPLNRDLAAIAAHIRGRLQATAAGWTFRLAKDRAAQIR